MPHDKAAWRITNPALNASKIQSRHISDVFKRYLVLKLLWSTYSYITAKEMEAERESLHKVFGYAKGEALEPFTKEVCTINFVVL